MTRLAIVSDIHANWQAWNAVMRDMAGLKVDGIVSLGDAAGYGPDPVRVLESVHAHVHYSVLGNHEAALCGKMDAALFHASARRALDWTRARLGRAALRFVNSWPLTLKGEGFRCAHAGFAPPGAFDYILEAEDALASWQCVGERLLFVGHSHVPGLYLLGASGIPRCIPAQDFEIEEEKRFLVNVGSVGQPRDGDARASYCLYDTRDRAVYWRRVPFDLEAFRQALETAGLPLDAHVFLQDDPLRRRAPLRERLDFSPPDTTRGQVHGAIEVGEITRLKRRMARWKMLTAGLGLLAAAGLAGGAIRQGRRPHPAVFEARPEQPRPDHALRFPALRLAKGQALPDWRIELGDRRRQHWRLDSDGGEGCLVLSSDTRDADIRVVSPALAVGDAQRVSAQVMTALGEAEAPHVEMIVRLTRRPPGAEPETLDRFIVRQPTEIRAGGWMLARRTERLLAHAETVQFEVRARFRGILRLKDPALVLRE